MRHHPACHPAFPAGGPPIWLSGATPAALARTGQLYDGWLPYPPDPADYESGLLDIRNAAAQAGRPPTGIAPRYSCPCEHPRPGRSRSGWLRPRCSACSRRFPGGGADVTERRGP
ncbi:MAG: LLM class flavin-dependent oxidoreductase [Streptosporangiaceae bacterium]